MEKNQIIEKYIEFVLENGQKPQSVYSFAKGLGMAETDFYNFFSSFEAIENSFWVNTFDMTLAKLESDKTYKKYGAKEKLLSFYYVWIATLRQYRSFVMTFYDTRLKSIPLNSSGLNLFKESFMKFADALVKEGTENNEIKQRAYLTDRYKYGLWIQTMFILNYWTNDQSQNFEMTDAAIEKSVALGFKLIADNAVDQIIDFGKFVLQKAV